jgi:hypothetical protein
MQELTRRLEIIEHTIRRDALNRAAAASPAPQRSSAGSVGRMVVT